MSELKTIYAEDTFDEDYMEYHHSDKRYYREVYLKSEADKVIADLKDKCNMHDFFWEGCGFAKRGFKNTIAVSEAFDKLEAENRRLKRALYKACANWADAVAFEETEGIGYDNSVAERGRKMESKCIKKAEENK